jgi:hypothetical protein
VVVASFPACYVTALLRVFYLPKTPFVPILSKPTVKTFERKLLPPPTANGHGPIQSEDTAAAR